MNIASFSGSLVSTSDATLIEKIFPESLCRGMKFWLCSYIYRQRMVRLTLNYVEILSKDDTAPPERRGDWGQMKSLCLSIRWGCTFVALSLLPSGGNVE